MKFILFAYKTTQTIFYDVLLNRQVASLLIKSCDLPIKICQNVSKNLEEYSWVILIDFLGGIKVDGFEEKNKLEDERELNCFWKMWKQLLCSECYLCSKSICSKLWFLSKSIYLKLPFCSKANFCVRNVVFDQKPFVPNCDFV
jgi:hypothetical protein